MSSTQGSDSGSNDTGSSTFDISTLSTTSALGSPQLSRASDTGTIRLNPAVVKKKGLKLASLQNNSSDSMLTTTGLTPIDDSDAEEKDVVKVISSRKPPNSKRLLKDLLTVPEDTCWGRERQSNRLRTRERHKMPPKQVKYWQVTLFLLNDIIGGWLILYTSILPGLYGWVLGMILLVGLWPLNLYVTHLLWKCANIFPGAISIGDLVYYLTRSAWAMYITFFFVNFTIALTLGYQIVAVAANIYYLAGFTTEQCEMAFIAGICIVLFPMTQLRTLHSLTIMNCINLVCMLCFVACFLYFLALNGKDENEVSRVGLNMEALAESVGSENINPKTHTSLLLGVDIALTAYQYQLLVLEIIAEMKDPMEFPKANYWCTPVVLFVVATCASFRYYFEGEVTDLNVTLPLAILESIFKREKNLPLAYFAVICFSIHLMGCCLIRSVILTRSTQLLIHPKIANERTWRSRLEWIGISIAILAVVWMLSVVIRATAFMSIVSGILTIALAIIMPIILFLFAQKISRKEIAKVELFVLYTLLCICFIYMILYFIKLGWRVSHNDYGHMLANRTRVNLEMMTDCRIH